MVQFYQRGVVPPSESCRLPDPHDPGYHDDLMVTVVCPHCQIKFLLLDRGENAEWTEAQAWWNKCRAEAEADRNVYIKMEEYRYE